MAAGRKQPQAASDQTAQHQKQAPNGQEKHGQDAGVRRLGLQDPFDDANRGEQPDRASGEAGCQNDKLLRGQAIASREN
jgi:hypothetical protein